MTGYTVHTGSSDEFARGWDRIFSEGARGKAAPARPKKSAAQKAPAKSSAAKGKRTR